MRENQSVSIGPPCVPIVSVRSFSRIPADINLDDVWTIVGPSAARNLDKMPMWKVICAAYLEGLNHGAGIASMKGGE